MTIRLRDRVVLLEPATHTDPDTDIAVTDDTAPPTRHEAVPFHGEQQASAEGTVVDDTTVTRWTGWLGPEWDGKITSDWSVEWRGRTYSIDGDIEPHEGRGRVQHLTVTLKRVNR